MTKQELVKGMQNLTGSSFISREEVARFVGYRDPHSVDKYLYGLDKIERRYFIPDVADSLMRAARA